MRYADNSFVSNPGSPLHTIYSPKVGKDGVVELVESGVENTDDVIQSFAESTDIRVILSRVANGETELLHQRNGIFGDFTGMPKTYAEALQLHIDANRLFASLPADVREKFGNDENRFFAEAGTSEWSEKLHAILPEEMRSMNNKPVDASVDPVKPVVEEK